MLNEEITQKKLKPLISLAIKEDLGEGDIGEGDITSNAIFGNTNNSESIIIAKENGIFCGGPLIKLIYEEIDTSLKITVFKNDGDEVIKNTEVARIEGQTKSILNGERIVLNFIQHMSGIATKTKIFCSLIQGTEIKILDTRKTLPAFRMLDKYSVKKGGGQNHRLGLFDMVLIKDNHIKAAGSITEAVTCVRKKYGEKYIIEVETTNLDEVNEAVETGIDIIMLDNMSKDTMEKAIDLIRGRSKIEVSGNIDEERIKKIKDLNIDYISIGALTHSVKSLDLSMKFS